MESQNNHRFILGSRVDATSYDAASTQIIEWANDGRPRYVCVTSVHGIIEAVDRPQFKQVLNGADLITPDGMPLVWALKLLGVRQAERVYGPNLTLHVCRKAEEADIPIGLYGGTPKSLEDFCGFLQTRFPNLSIVCRISPPFRPLTDQEDAEYTREISDSGARILLVGIGCPKQEQWMAAHRDVLPAVMIGVGAAFDFYSGRVPQAPVWMQDAGLEWFYRLSREPKRLWRRYTRIVPMFLMRFTLEYLRVKTRFSPG